MHYIGYYRKHANQINDSFVDCGIKQSKGKKSQLHLSRSLSSLENSFAVLD